MQNIKSIDEFLQYLFFYYNEFIFGNSLPKCQINLYRKKDSSGFFISKRWINSEELVFHEINLNPQDLELEPEKWHAILVYYMVHLWQYVNKTDAKEHNYHNKIFIRKMEEIGFIVECLSELGGKKTWRKISYRSKSGGLFYKLHNALQIKECEYHPLPEPESEDKKKEKQIKYQCSSCESNRWGKKELIDVCWECFCLRIPLNIPKEEYSPAYRKQVQIANKVLAKLKGQKNRLYLEESEKYEDGVWGSRVQVAVSS